MASHSFQNIFFYWLTNTGGFYRAPFTDCTCIHVSIGVNYNIVQTMRRIYFYYRCVEPCTLTHLQEVTWFVLIYLPYSKKAENVISERKRLFNLHILYVIISNISSQKYINHTGYFRIDKFFQTFITSRYICSKVKGKMQRKNTNIFKYLLLPIAKCHTTREGLFKI